MDKITTVTVQILGKDYDVACDVGEVDALKASARHVDHRMQTISNAGNVIGLDRIAVLAALNIANEYLLAESTRKETENHIDTLTHKLRQAVDEQISVDAL